jgi:hypothetical protein
MHVMERGAIRFAEKVLALLDEGQFTATYKYAVLLGLLRPGAGECRSRRRGAVRTPWWTQA